VQAKLCISKHRSVSLGYQHVQNRTLTCLALQMSPNMISTASPKTHVVEHWIAVSAAEGLIDLRDEELVIRAVGCRECQGCVCPCH
jgi:hypothetical protein